MKVYAFLALLGGAAMAAQAEGKCNALAKQSKAYLRASDAVRQMPEFRSWSASHSLPVAFGAAVDKEQLVQGRCYWSVTVYASHPERAEYWHSFYVSRSTNTVAFIQDPRSGDPIALSAWREQANESSKKK